MSAIRRLGKKSNPKVRSKILSFFPTHSVYLEPFFGGGGMFFYKPRSKHSFLNDLDNDVYNSFCVISQKKELLLEYIDLVPYHVKAFQFFKELKPKNDIEQAAKFLILSSWGYMGTPGTLRLGTSDNKKQLISEIKKTYYALASGENRFLNCDFRKFFNSVNFRKPTELCPERLDDRSKCFAYLDPPYLGTGNNYNTPKWTEADVVDLMDIMANQGIKMAMSEFDHPFIIAEAEKRGFKVIQLGERQNMKNRRSEILILNYEINNKLF